MIWVCKQRVEREGHSTNPDKRNEGPKQVVMEKQPMPEVLQRKTPRDLLDISLWK